MDVNDIAPPSAEAWKPDIGDTVKGVIVHIGETVRDNFERTGKEKSLRIVLEQDDGEPVSVYAVTDNDHPGGNPKRDARAIAAAVRAAGETQLLEGGILAIKRIDDVPSEKGLSPAKAYAAEYKPPATTLPTGEDAADGAVTGLI